MHSGSFTSRPTPFCLCLSSLVRLFCPYMSFPPPLLPPEDGRSHFRAREPNEGEGHGAEHRDVREHGFRDVGEDIEPNVGEGVDMHAILRGHVVPVGENGEKGDNGEEKRGTKERSAGAGRGARGGHGEC